MVALPAAAFVPPGSFVLKQAARQARARVGLTATYAVRTVDGPTGSARLTVQRDGARFETASPPPAAAVLAQLLAGDARGAARALGVEAEASALDRFDGHAAVTVGVMRRGDAGPQVWVDHERFVVLRALTGDLDIRLLRTDGLLSVAGMPARIEVHLGGRLVWEAWLTSPLRRP